MIKCESLTNLDKLFLNYEGWSGGDGVFAFQYQNELIWYFSDTFIGESTKEGIRINFEMINNSLGISPLNLTKIDFYYPKNPVRSVFEAYNNYFWLQDGLIENDNLYISALRMENDIFSALPFMIKGVSLIKLKLPFKEKIEYEISDITKDDRLILMTSIIKKDDYYYLYSYLDDKGSKKLVLARVKSLDFKNIEYLNKDKVFTNDPNDLYIIKEDFASEFKVFYDDGYYYIAYTKKSIGSKIYLTRSLDLINFDKEILVYDAPLHKGNIITYNSKLQPALSTNDYFVISYNVNSLVNEDHKYLDIYRPRFLKISKEEVKREFESF